MSAEMIECPKCGTTNDADEEVCIQCGIVFWKYRDKITQDSGLSDKEKERKII